ncbi:MAG: Flp pilus assembly protein CpaB [Hyphomicrobiaceae bacterium]
MKRAQLIGIGLASICGIGAFVGMKSLQKPKVQTRIEVKANTVKVLVARADIGLGSLTTEQSFRWQDYPETAVPPGAISCKSSSCSARDYAGGIARTPIMREELITKSKIVKAGEGGVLASILPAGMRAVSTKISEDSAVGKMILPNDHVDVILTRRLRSKTGQDEHVSDTLFRNTRVLAIGQRIEIKDGQKNAEGNTATLELTPRQAEQLTLAKSMGEISLVLRSVADFKEQKGDGKDFKADRDRGDGIKMLKYGVKSRAVVAN